MLRRFLMAVSFAVASDAMADLTTGCRAEEPWKQHVVHRGVASLNAYGGDFTKDGLPDVITNCGGKTRLLVAPDWKELIIDETPGRDAIHCEAFDVDGDGDLDWMGARYKPGLVFWLEQPDDPLAGPWKSRVVDDQINGIHGLLQADVDGDGRTDLIANSAQPVGAFPESAAWLRVPKDPRNADRWERFLFAVGDAPGLSHYFGFGDVNGDGRKDISLAAKGGPEAKPDNGRWFAWWEAPADPRGRWTKHLVAEGQLGATNIMPADVNGDGKTDFIATRGHDLGVLWFEGPDWKPHVMHETIREPHCLQVADFDADGDVDAATCGYGDRLAVWLENDGKGGFTSHTIATNQAAYDLRAVDMDRDGDLDVLIAGQQSLNVAWYENPLGQPRPGAGLDAPARIELAGDWRVTVTADLNGMPVSATLDVPPPDVTTVADERHDPFPNFNPKAAGWLRGAQLRGLRAVECTIRGGLDPASLVVRSGTDAAAITFEKGRDYEADLDWATVGRLKDGRIPFDRPVFVSYRHTRRRLDSVVLTPPGGIVFRKGTPHVALCEPPPLAPGERRLANIHLSGFMPALTADSLFPVLETSYPAPPRTVPTLARSRLPKTVQKLESGEPLTILAWGDSVTLSNRWQRMFVERLRAKYPKARIELVTEAWGGRTTTSYLAEPPGSQHNFREKVLERKPDLVVSEFVNDARLSPEQVDEQYGRILRDFQSIGAEWVILTPHYTMPEWMGFTRQREIDEDPRPYVAGVRRFAERHGLAVADASRRYGRLWRQGIPYVTLMENGINHPNDFGHTLFADSLMALFD